MPELQQYEYRDLINVRKEILNRFEWVINELEQTIENLEARQLTVADAQQRIDRPLVKEVCFYSLTLICISRIELSEKKKRIDIICCIVR
jgi:predicted rRNA methylase YqxC with S4 and FtsJ domains